MLQLAAADPRVVAGAVVASLALTAGDRWSDLDLTFAVADEHPLGAVLEDWTHRLVEAWEASRLFDLPSGPSIYRVFLLPGCLQFDLSFTPAAQFGARGPRFRLLFGSAQTQPFPQPPEPGELFGYAVHHALRARFCIERGRLWQAEYWLHATRDYALSLACRSRGLPSTNGRGYDELPEEVLAATITGLLSQTEKVRELAGLVEPQLRLLADRWEA